MSSRSDDIGGSLNAEQEVQPLHKPFSWVHTEPVSRGASFIECVADMCAGLQTCLQLVHSTDLALHAREMDDDEAMPILGTVDKERLLRLAIAVTGALADGAHQEVQWISDQARVAEKEGVR